MADRLGHVLFWAGVLIAAVLIGFAIFVLYEPSVPAQNRAILMGLACGLAVLAFLIGKACRYVLSGD